MSSGNNARQYFFRRHPRVAIFIILLSLPLTLCLAEGLLFYFLHHPITVQRFPYLHRAVTHLYYLHELDFLQYLPQCAEYDSRLSYVMKPGQCHHRSVEFDCIYHINKMGLRDDDASLEKPEIIVLGDSYAWGWGMDHEKIFSTLLEKESGLKTLNVSTSSYGTAREFMLLDKLDASALKYLVIQYCTNDFEENKQYVDDGMNLKIQSREAYEAISKNHSGRIRYKPFLYLYTLAKLSWQSIIGYASSGKKSANTKEAAVTAVTGEINKNPSVIGPEDSARYFLEIVKSKSWLDSVQVMVMSISGAVYTSPSFIQALAKIKNTPAEPAFIQNMKLIDAGSEVKREDYFILDNHLNESGHRKVADLLLNEIRQNGGK